MRHVRLAHTVLIAAAMAACDLVPASNAGREADAPPADAPPAAEPPPTDTPPQEGETPDDMHLVRPGACPFECCQYGTWTARVPITLYATERDTLNVLGRIDARTQFQAETGNVHVSPVGLVVVTDSLYVEGPGGAATMLLPGDTVRVLDYVGEGYYNLRANGEELSASAFWAPPGVDLSTYGIGDVRGELVRAPGYDWWVRIREADREGWIRMTDEVRVDGDDACAGPPMP